MENSKPLAGVKVVELGTLIAGPFAARIMAEFGAEVVKIESPDGGDPLRKWRKLYQGTSLWWFVQARNKRSVTVNLKHPDGIAIVKRLVAEADIVIENLRPGVLEKLGLGWEALSALTVGMILRSISERSGVLGKIVVSLVGLAWNLATFLVVPVLAAEDVGPIDAVKRSGAYLRKTWGEQIVGNAGMGAVFGVMTFGSILLGLILFIAAAFTESTALMAMVGVGLVVTLVGIALISATLGGIYAAALYRYASEGDAGTFFSPDMVKGAFQQKGRTG